MNEALLKECTYIHARAIATQIEMESMKAANARYPEGQKPFRPKDFMDLIDRNGLNHNQIMIAFQNCY